MSTQPEIVSAGAEFVRADLHVHSYGAGGSFEVTDSSMTPENIVDTAIAKGISLVAITDHNEIENVKVALAHADGKDVLVIPGIEVSTTQGHLLLYFETYEALRKFHGKLEIDSSKERCSAGITHCLDLADQFGGIGILAHIDLKSGFEQTIARFSKEMDAIVAHPHLYGFEISNRDSISLYTDDDESNDRKKLIRLRREKLSLDTDLDLAKVMFSDSHTLVRLG